MFPDSANAHATKVKRKTLLGADVLAAMGDMEFEHFVPDLQESLAGECVNPLTLML